MSRPSELQSHEEHSDKTPRWDVRITVVTIVTTITTLVVAIWYVFAISGLTKTIPLTFYKVGFLRALEPSQMAPPVSTTFPGYKLVYVQDFQGTSVPPGWDVFTGVPGGDPGGQFGRQHVVVSGGLLHLNAWKDPKYGGKWVTGGLCHCGLAHMYGAYFVRSRLTGAGPNEAQLLWPADNTWPPEIDFNETGGTDKSTSSTLHFGAKNNIIQSSIRIDLLKWHTWGVIWSAKSIEYVVDGRVWANVTTPSEIPQVPMRLDLEQRTKCQLGNQCPKVPVSMLVDWVAEYSLK